MSSIIKKLSSHKLVKKKPKLKPNKASLKLEDKKIENIFDDPNKFFKDEYEEVKKTLFWK